MNYTCDIARYLSKLMWLLLVAHRPNYHLPHPAELSAACLVALLAACIGFSTICVFALFVTILLHVERKFRDEIKIGGFHQHSIFQVSFFCDCFRGKKERQRQHTGE